MPLFVVVPLLCLGKFESNFNCEPIIYHLPESPDPQTLPDAGDYDKQDADKDDDGSSEKERVEGVKKISAEEINSRTP